VYADVVMDGQGRRLVLTNFFGDENLFLS